ncbi:hypothetical protein O3M35_006721 [Rhynocoris fuscipes]|uniref:Uncharacterized protein n=1 Tax=Rhynocoris fuscipes TaxID=488301 RepID=A0AAW1DLR5_9HEMI
MESERLIKLADCLSNSFKTDFEKNKEMVALLKKGQGEPNALNSSRPDLMNSRSFKRNFNEEQTKPRTVNRGSSITRVDKLTLEKILKYLEEKIPKMSEDMIQTKLHCTELEEKLNNVQQELDITKKAYAELIFYELNKDNKMKIKLDKDDVSTDTKSTNTNHKQEEQVSSKGAKDPDKKKKGQKKKKI